MTGPSRISEFLPRGLSRFALPAIIAGIVLLALFSPSVNSTSSFDPRLSSRLSGPNGAKGIHDIANRLGWKTQRRNTAPFDSIDSGTIIAELAPAIPLSERETSILLQRVREGASLLTVVERGTPLADSLGLSVDRVLTTVPIEPPANLKCSTQEPKGVFSILGRAALIRPFSEKPTGQRAEYRIFAASKGYTPRDSRYAAIGFALGKGRVAAVSDATFFRNDFLRVCRWGLGISTIRMLDYLSEGKAPRRTRIVFDEFHQGFGPQPSVTRAAGTFLFGTSWGSLILQLIAASLVFLLAIAPRPIPPRPAPRVQRRSQFEHVEALSSAYQHISATRTVIADLLRGVRRRLGRQASTPGPQSESDEVFLRRVALSHPELSTEVAAVSDALSDRTSPARLLHAVAAIETIERTIKR
jgi:hypothetical protein